MNKENYFARINEQGNFDLLHKSGERVTQIPGTIAPVVWPVDSDLSGYYEHPEGIVLSLGDVVKLDIEIEDEPDIDDGAHCQGCGAPITDGQHDDNHGYCSGCDENEEPCYKCGDYCDGSCGIE